MIKSKLIMVISSIGLVATLSVGGIFLNSNEKISQDNTVKTESKEEALSNVANKEGSETTTNNNVTNGQDNSTEEVAVNDDKIVSNNDNIVSNNDNTINSSIEENNLTEEEVAVEIEEAKYRPSWNKPSYNKPNTPSDTPSQDTNNPSQDSNTPSETPNDNPVVSDSNYIAEIEQAIFERVNSERAAAGLPALSYNTTMENYARIKSKDMGDNGYFSHEDLQGNLITEQMKADGVTYKAWGENIAYIQGVSGNSTLATQFMDNWMNSSGHRANILSTNFSSIGIGVYKIGNKYYATQEFYR